MYKVFTLNGRKYLYSAINKKIAAISKESEDILCCPFDNNRKNIKGNDEIELLTKEGFLGCYNPTFENPAVKFIDENINYRRKYLVLQVTQKCNLICGYCPYACNDNDSRSHKNINMSFEIAIKAIDDFIKHSRDIKILNIGFYGGEPLLNIKLISQAVNYIESKVTNKKIIYSMTTNGTLLSENIVKYLVSKDFKLTISLDGDKILHDKYRKFPDNSGSFLLVYSNLKYIYDNYFDYWKENVSFNAVVNSYMNFNRSLSFFKKNNIFETSQGVRINFSDNKISNEIIQGKGIEHKINNLNLQNRKKYFLELMLCFYQKRKTPPNYLSDDINTLEKLDLNQYNEFFSLDTCIHPQGQCISGATKMMVDVYGDCWPCEKINEKCDFCKIGNIFSGISTERIAAQMNISRLTEKECVNCWAIHHCSFCLASFNQYSHVTRKLKLQKCERDKYRLEELIKIYTAIQNTYLKYNYKKEGYT